MTPENVMTVGRQTLEIVALMAGPLLISSLIVGLIIAMFQAATQIQEMTLTFVPKIVATVLAIIFYLFYRAWPVLSLSFILENPSNNMTAGGIWAPLGDFRLRFRSFSSESRTSRG